MSRIVVGFVVLIGLVAGVVLVGPARLGGAQDDGFAPTMAALATRLATPAASDDVDLLTRVAALETRVTALETAIAAAPTSPADSTPSVVFTPPVSPTVPATPESDVLVETLFDDVQGSTDEFGRVPLARLTFAPGAELPATFLGGPLLAVVESGTFDVLIGTSTTVLDAGGRVETAVGENLAARNTGETDGSLLVLSLPLDDGGFAPLAVAGPPEQSPAEGVSYRLLFLRLALAERLLPGRFTVARVTIASGASLDAVDLGGPTPTRRVQLLVEVGTVAVIGVVAATPAARATPGDEGDDLLHAGDEAHFEAPEEAGLRSAGPEPAVVLIVRFAEAEGD